MGETFRLAVANFAERHQIPVIRFAKHDPTPPACKLSATALGQPTCRLSSIAG